MPWPPSRFPSVLLGLTLLFLCISPDSQGRAANHGGGPKNAAAQLKTSARESADPDPEVMDYEGPKANVNSRSLSRISWPLLQRSETQIVSKRIAC
ncbi:Dof-type domain-containing protein [Psidium guajava]|nr:Dof-type domain-containing protein [Psidium guajava]